jgi:PAS domain S-box-containing protein
MSLCASPGEALPDLLEARKEDILRRWEARVSRMLGEGLLPRAERVDSLPDFVDSVVQALRGLHEPSGPGGARALGGRHGRERYQAGIGLASVVHEYGLLRDAILEVLEEAGWVPELSALRALNRALDAGLADAVAQHSGAHERVVQATEARLLRILDHAPTSIYAKDTQGRYLFVNRAFAHTIGRSREEILDRTDEELLMPPGMVEVCGASDRQVLASGHSVSTDEQIPQRDGVHTYHSLKFPLPDVNGRVGAVCGISTDVTEARRAERERDEAREHLRRVITQLPIILWATDARGILTLFEGEGLRALGLARGQFVGRSAFELYADRPDMLAATRQAQAGQSFSMELEMGGSWFLAQVTPVLGPDGTVVSVAGVSLDITERRRAEEVLRQSETRYRLATLATSDVIYDWELATGHIEWSELAARQFRLVSGPPRLDIDWWAQSIHPEDRERVARDMQAVIDAGQDHWTDEYRFRRGDGTWAVISDQGRVVRDAAGRAVRMVGAMHDITEQRASEAEARRRADFEQLLIGIVGHDLRNPLSAITMASTTLLRCESLDTRQRTALARILSSAERATRMLRDVLDFTQARLGGGIPMQPRPVELHELTRQVVDEVRLAHPERQLEVECRGDGRGVWDPDRLAQVITNLVSNALHHGLAHCPVRVRTHGTHDAVTLAVHNVGPPIPTDLRPRLFEPMKRAAPKEARSSHGLGLGLFIVKHIVDAHGGSLRVHSTEQDGTTFVVRLPRHS